MYFQSISIEKLQKFPLTFSEPISCSMFISVQQTLALFHMIRALIEHAILKSLSQNSQNVIVHLTISFKLLIGFEFANGIVCVALIDGGHSAQFLMVPGIVFLVGLNDGF